MSSQSARLHSKRDPFLEAERQLRTIPDPESAGLFLFVDPGMDYLSQKALELFPRASRLSLYTDRFQFEQRIASSSPAFCFHDTENLLAWLEPRLPSILLRNPRFLIHPISRLQRPGDYSSLESALSSLIARIQKEVLTTGYFGPAVLRNLKVQRRSLRSTDSILPVAIADKHSSKLPVIAASGPSLEQSRRFLEEHRGRIFLLSLPSSLDFLLSCGIDPEVVVSLDPGYWASRHLDRFVHRTKAVLWTGLTSRLGSQPIPPGRVRFFSTGNPLESLVLGDFDPSLPRIPEAATVSAAAIELCRRIWGRPILVLGMDLQPRQLLSHVHPHGFDQFRLRNSNRLSPVESLKSVGGLTGEGTNQLEHYRRWFAANARDWKDCVYEPRNTNREAGLEQIDDPRSLLDQIPPPSAEKSRLSATRDSAMSSISIAHLTEAVRRLTEAPGRWLLDNESLSLDLDYALRQIDYFAYKNLLAGKFEGARMLLDKIAEIERWN